MQCYLFLHENECSLLDGILFGRTSHVQMSFDELSRCHAAPKQSHKADIRECLRHVVKNDYDKLTQETLIKICNVHNLKGHLKLFNKSNNNS